MKKGTRLSFVFKTSSEQVIGPYIQRAPLRVQRRIYTLKQMKLALPNRHRIFRSIRYSKDVLRRDCLKIAVSQSFGAHRLCNIKAVRKQERHTVAVF